VFDRKLIGGQCEYVCVDVDLHKGDEYRARGWQGTFEKDVVGGVEVGAACDEDGVEVSGCDFLSVGDAKGVVSSWHISLGRHASEKRW
jgi:hypothetical protein